MQKNDGRERGIDAEQTRSHGEESRQGEHAIMRSHAREGRQEEHAIMKKSHGRVLKD